MAVTGKDGKGGMDPGKYVRYTAEQVEALERLYRDCPKPSSIRRQQLIRECPILSNIEPKQIKVWFQNRRCREKQRKEASRLQTVNRKLTAMNKLLMEENDRLQKQVSQLVYENGYFRQQLQNASIATTDNSCESVVTSGQHQQQNHLTPRQPPRDASPAGLLPIGEGSSSATSSYEICTPEVKALHILSQNIQSLISVENQADFSDAQITVGDHDVPVHRCILGVRSPFFRNLFSKKKTTIRSSSTTDSSSSTSTGEGLKYELKELLSEWNVGYEAFMIVLGYLYSGKLIEPPSGVCTCVDHECPHDACRPAIDFALELLYSAFVFQIPELVSLSQRHLLEIVENAYVEDVIPILNVANKCQTGNDPLLTKCLEIVARSDIDHTAFEKELPTQVVAQLVELRSQLGLEIRDTISMHYKNVRRIQRALDSDDVELVKMLLTEGPVTLDDAYALHYAAAYCDSKITRELLDLGNADVNLINARGYSVLHIAAMRKEPTILVSLLTKGADPSEVTKDGRNALKISSRLTRAIDYNSSTATGRETPKDRLCIEILEQAERRDPLLGDASHSLALAGDDLRMKLLYLENRVALARLLFPLEAKLVMDIAHVGSTSEFTCTGNSNLASVNRGTSVDLNVTPIAINKEHLSRVKALSKTVELGKRFFPRCSDVLNKIMDDEMSEFALLEKGTSEEQRLKRQRYDELKAVVSEAFMQDKEEFAKSSLSSSSSSSSLRDGQRNKKVPKLQ